MLKAPAYISPGQRPGLGAAFFWRAPKGSGESIIMPQSLAKNLLHLVFRTSNREPVLVDPLRARLSADAAGVLWDLDSPAIAIHAWRDHRQVLLRLSQNPALSPVVMEVTRATSKWLKTKGAELVKFHWQAGYGALSIELYDLESDESHLWDCTRLRPYRGVRGGAAARHASNRAGV